MEKTITTVKAFYMGKQATKVISIPKKIREKLGEPNTDLFIVKLDTKGRIIYEPIKKC